MSADLTEFSSTNIPAWVAPTAREIDDLPAEQVLTIAETTWPEMERDAWRVALCLARAERDELYRAYGYGSVNEWARERMGKSQGTVAKFLAVGRFALKLPVEKRAQAMVTAPTTLYESGITKLAKLDEDEALRLASSGQSQRDLKAAVNVRLSTALHLDTGELRAFKLLLRQEQQVKLSGLLHFVRFLCQSPHPTDAEVFELIEADVADLVEAFWARQSPLPERFPLREILAGHVRCIECGATNGNRLEGHHSVPRSVKHRDEQGRLDGTDSPLVWLCPEHHQVVTDNYDGTWRDHVERWRARKDLGWFRDAIEVFLDGRELGAIGRQAA